MRCYVVQPGAHFSTADVYDGLCAGLRANGVEVLEGRLDTIMQWYAAAGVEGRKNGVFTDAVLDDGFFNYSALASAHITRHILLSEPDYVIVVSGHNYNAADVGILRRAGIPVALVGTEAPYWGDFEIRYAARCNVAFTNERRAVARWQAMGVERVHYLPHAYNPELHWPGAPDPARACDVFFVGSLFDERRALFSAIDWDGIAFVRRGFDPLTLESDTLKNSDTAAYYRAAKVNLNHHRTTKIFGSGEHIAVDSAESLGPRAYEIAACGAFQLCDDSRPELRELFGASVPTYRAGDAADLKRQIDYWLARPDERADRAAEALHHVRPHSWTRRAAHILEAL